jgi:hypothetical protein
MLPISQAKFSKFAAGRASTTAALAWVPCGILRNEKK